MGFETLINKKSLVWNTVSQEPINGQQTHPPTKTIPRSNPPLPHPQGSLRSSPLRFLNPSSQAGQARKTREGIGQKGETYLPSDLARLSCLPRLAWRKRKRLLRRLPARLFCLPKDAEPMMSPLMLAIIRHLNIPWPRLLFLVTHVKMIWYVFQ